MSDADNDESRLRLHVLPKLGDMELGAVKARHLAKLWAEFRANKDMADKTRYNIYSTLSALYRDAEIDGLVERSPCILTKHQLGECKDKDPLFRERAIYWLDEYLTLVHDDRIPLERRVRYAFAGLGCLRTGELAGLRWSFLDDDRSPLAAIKIRFTYSKPCPENKRARDMPIHVVLALLLAEWRATGWEATFGRQPKPDDLVMPYLKRRPGRRGRHGDPIGEMARWRC